ncbi:MAG: hypothetical protein EBQ83_06865 [Burkholderiaceae bacterium]|nr:hypothetical protein [Burkholderiaceae bacterium]
MNTAGDELNKPWLKNYPAGVPQQIDIHGITRYLIYLANRLSVFRNVKPINILARHSHLASSIRLRKILPRIYKVWA